MTLWNQNKSIHFQVFATFEPISSNCRPRPINYKIKGKLMVVFFIYKNSVLVRKRSCVLQFLSSRNKNGLCFDRLQIDTRINKIHLFLSYSKQNKLEHHKKWDNWNNSITKYQSLESKLISPAPKMYQKYYICYQTKF